jgi:hypothetical protein
MDRIVRKVLRKLGSGSRSAVAPKFRQNFTLEPLETRLLLDATPFLLDAGSEALDVTLTVADISGVPSIQFVNKGTAIATRALADTSEIVITGSDQDDVLTIDLGQGGSFGSVPVVFHGVSGFDTVVIAGGPFDTATYEATGADTGGITLSGSSTLTIAYAGTESIIDIVEATNRVFINATSLHQEIRLSEDGEFNGLNLIDSNDTGGFTPILFAEPAETIEIRGSDAGDSFLVGELEIEFAANVSIQGGVGFRHSDRTRYREHLEGHRTKRRSIERHDYIRRRREPGGRRRHRRYVCPRIRRKSFGLDKRRRRRIRQSDHPQRYGNRRCESRCVRHRQLRRTYSSLRRA